MRVKLTTKSTCLVIVLTIIFTITKALTNFNSDFCETVPSYTDCTEHIAFKQEEGHSFTRDQLIHGLKEKTFKRIILLTGAGISVSAGIPDFRSKTGIYSQLGECDLPHPEAIFELSYFKHHPETFYKVAKVLMSYSPKPTIAHYFIKMLADEGVLSVDFTQNIDGLEIAAGIDPSLLIEAHGHTRSAHCAVCHKEKSIDELKRHIQEGKVYRCECSGPVKPDIIFFGEQLPVSFFEAHKKVAEADLVIVMGTSLRVAPFSYLIHLVHQETPIVLINRENSAIKKQNFLFLEGDIDELVVKIIIDVEWEKKLERVKLIDV